MCKKNSEDSARVTSVLTRVARRLGYVITASDLHPVTPGNSMHKYADDSYLVVPANNIHSSVAEISHIEKWAAENIEQFSSQFQEVS